MRVFFLACMLALLPSVVQAANVDIGLDQGGISFSPSTFYQGDTVRVYARIRNLGDTDVTATVYFYEGSTVLGRGQVVSLRAEGAPEEVFVDFVVPAGSFNIRAVLGGADPSETNLANNEATTPLYAAVADDDRDGVLNDEDNCVVEANATQKDTDGDGVGDVCDTDDDNDAIVDVNDDEPLVPFVDEPTEDTPVLEEKPRTWPVVQPTVATKTVAVAPSTTATTPTVGQGNSVAVAALAEETAETQGIARPTSAYGIFPSVFAATDAVGGGEDVSFFRAENPWLYVVIALLAVVLCGALVAIGYLRFRAAPETEDESDV